MKRIFSIFFAMLLLVECAGESNDSSSQLFLGILNQQSLTLNHSDRKPSERIITIPTYYVDSISGNDSNAGSKSAPFRTITKAILIAKADGTRVITVAPGIYDTSIGETFPIYIPEGVNVYGDLDGKGLVGGSSSIYAGPPGTTPKTGSTWIKGGGFDIYHTSWNATLIPKSNSQIAGFKITNPNPMSPGGSFTRVISMQNFVSVRIKNNTITEIPSGAGAGIFFENFNVTDLGENIISGNHITSGYWGIADYGIRASGDKVENNFISQNFVGISTTQGLDLGQGATGSLGNNTISCNTYEDLLIGGNNTKNQYAMNNYWDHWAPTMSSAHSDGLDIKNNNNLALVYYAGGGVAPNACN
ncbi:DUF1565 domain-containing protein [Leptospira santarosai]|uniref:LIC10774 family surface protein n=1 Tax=Leptospira santarosai TaxID=28183 RepID=UPI0024AED5CB|nr:DUF1565 domain-containing protein [Leptospira santarosai]MDI7221932.1 DUF1565 domain-containing protein [Leptospira santarosai]